MYRQTGSFLSVSLLLALFSSTIESFSQNPENEPHDVLIENHAVFVGDTAAGLPMPLEGGRGNVMYMFSGGGPAHQTVQGAPYSAEAVTETTQTLLDGNRIIRKHSASLYRDSQGRTRREQTFSPRDEGAHTSITIDDPVTGTHIVLDPQRKTARKFQRPEFKPAQTEQPTSPEPVRQRIRLAGGPLPTPPLAGVAVDFFRAELPKPTTESLGKRVVEGLEVEGTRSTVTIPAGQIGNELPIQMVTERWYSPELKVLVMSKHNDPRMGETVYRLSQINRSEPAPYLFEIPGDYALEETPPAYRMERRVFREKP